MIPCLHPSRPSMVQTGKYSKIGSTKLTKHAEPVTEDLGPELFKKSAGAVRQVILSCNNLSDDELSH